MRILYYADGRSPTTMNWLQYWLESSHQVHLVSSYPCAEPAGLASFHILPVAFSGLKSSPGTAHQKKGLLWKSGLLPMRLFLRQWLAPITIPKAGIAIKNIVDQIQPDLVHAMRIPFEGMTTASAGLQVPLLVSVWGNDFTLHARSSPWMAVWTKRALRAADALLADCQRDIRIAHQLGLKENRLTLVIPGNGGIQSRLFHPPAYLVLEPVIINPRGFRSYLRTDTFFKAIPLVLKQVPKARFLCPGMAGDPAALDWVSRLGIAQSVQLLPHCSPVEMADLYRSAAILVSPSTHDGTPNSVLEGMACACLPVVGDLESLREWITPYRNGLLIDPSDAQDLADAILAGWHDPEFRARAALQNNRIIADRAEYGNCMQQVEKFYSSMVKG